MYREEADGSAVVWGVAVAPFVPVQHMQVDVSTVNRLGNYCFRFARERGWMQTADEMGHSATCAQTSEARPVVEQRGCAHTGSDNTFFFAGVEETLDNPYPDLELSLKPSTLFAEVRFFLAHVGNSSYSVYSQLYTYLDGPDEAARNLLGSFKVTTVWVSKLQRAPSALPAGKRSLLLSIIEKNASKMPPSDVTRTQRLSVSDLLLQSGWFANAAAIASMEIAAYSPVSAPPSDGFLVSLPHVGAAAPLWLLHRRHFTLRESDIDFNLHVNQLVMKLFVLDAFRGATADARCAYSRLLRPGVPPNRADLLVRKFRIDYVREIPASCVAAEVFLFPADMARAKAQFCSAGAPADCGGAGGARTAGIPNNDAADAPVVGLVDIGFFIVGVPSLDSASPKDGFIAAVGVMSTSTCFLH
ncbi:hypothetical protein, conserved [Leishmania tarentolae]|uniref:Uncharacterized protein n=1 Tax=Leishmania tarentolae TaxID=5689 RepID=A0A640KI79_LEITA|nr:hypothetical protein, conserved [Leishmania tarentolae]GET89421.1 hypothetical protein, conserved [Leishmania tarentolae]